MGKYTASFVFVTLVLALVLVPTGGNAAEYRAISIDGWYNGMWTENEITNVSGTGMLDLAQQGHYNVIVPQIRKKADALYNSTYGGPTGAGEPKPSQVSPSFDPLAYMIQQAHAVGIKVYPWIGTHSVATVPRDGFPEHDWFYDSHNDWLTRNSAGNLVYADGWYLDPGVPDGEEYTVNVIMDIVNNYDIDGIQWDRIRLPGASYGYNAIARARYLAECAEPGPDPDWGDWRRKQLTNFVARVYAQIMEVKPYIVVGVDSWADSSSGAASYYQDVPTWMAGHWLDIDCPMNYTATNSTFNSTLNTHLDNRAGRYVYSLHNLGSNTLANACQQILNCRSLNTTKGVPWGAQCYSYRYAVTTRVGWFDYVTAAGRPYQNTDTVPALPWKTDGSNTIILGRVTDASHPNDPVYHDWVNRATVTLYHAGPPVINRTTETDQTGYFVFSDVSPKAQTSGYTITVHKTGFTDRVFPAQAIAGGQVLRIDAELGTFTTSSPSSAVPRKACFSLPYEPVDPAPESVFTIPVHYKLWKWDRVYHGWQPYDMNSPEVFGNMSLDEGYWLRITSPYTISYQAYGTTTASRSQLLPKAGWSIIGCPYGTETPWENMTITNGSTTVSLAQAKLNGWVNSIGNWWDAEGQGFLTVGPPEDNPWTENLQPWHGHWFKTYVDDLTLTQKP